MKIEKVTKVANSTFVPEEHPALALMNTVLRVGDELVDTLQTDDDAVAWLKRAGWPLSPGFESSELLRSTRELREVVRALVEARKAGKRLEFHRLNSFLADSRSHLRLIPARGSVVTIQREWQQLTPRQALGPIAEAAAELIAGGEFDLIRRCEDTACVLWFYDRTKSHRRRWCSTATCGNRNKVRAFRERRSAQAQPEPKRSR